MALILHTVETEEYSILRATTADYAVRSLEPLAEQLDNAWEPPVRESMSRASELGVLSALAPEDAGGGGLDDYAFCIALEEMAVESAGAAAALLIHNAAMLPAIQAGGGSELKRLLEAAFPLSLAFSQSLSISGGNVSGHVPWAFNAPAASMFTLLVQEGEGVAAAIVEAGADGLTVQPHPYQLGLRAARSASLDLNGVTPVAVIRGDGGMRGACERILHLGFAAVATGIARKSFQAAHAYASERYQGGAIIINHQQMRLFLADIFSGIEMARAMLRAACLNGDLARAISCRIEATDRALRSANDGLQIHGGYGYTEDYGMERLVRDATYCQIYPRTNEESRLELLGLMEDG
jgi:butyryl-CoA dehydrogenase